MWAVRAAEQHTKLSVLDDIIAGVREDLGARRAITSLEAIKAAAAQAAPALDAFAALGGHADQAARDTTLRVISEVKRKSPSKGALADIPAPAVLAGWRPDDAGPGPKIHLDPRL